MRRLAVRLAAFLLFAAPVLLTACGSSGTAANAADRQFLQDMLPHHRQAIAAAQLAETHASDPRVRAFAQRIVAEQTPEVQRMEAAARGLPLDETTGAAMAVNRISPQTLQALGSLTGTAFDKAFLADSISSEKGAVQMAQAELAGGHDPAAKAIAGPIAGADSPGSEIPQLQALLAQLG